MLWNQSPNSEISRASTSRLGSVRSVMEFGATFWILLDMTEARTLSPVQGKLDAPEVLGLAKELRGTNFGVNWPEQQLHDDSVRGIA